jgi:hypothetical protein
MFALYVKTKNFHWHVCGPHFRDYHLLLDEQGDQIFATIDAIAVALAAGAADKITAGGPRAPEIFNTSQGSQFTSATLNRYPTRTFNSLLVCRCVQPILAILGGGRSCTEKDVTACGLRQVKVRLDYIFSDGKPRRSGYSTVAEDGSLISSTSFTQP